MQARYAAFVETEQHSLVAEVGVARWQGDRHVVLDLLEMRKVVLHQLVFERGSELVQPAEVDAQVAVPPQPGRRPILLRDH